MHLLSLPFADRPSNFFQDIFSRCLLCGACEDVCSRKLPITELITRARSRFPLFYGSHGVQKVLARKALSSPGLLHGLVQAGISLQRINALPAGSGLRLKLGLLEDFSIFSESEPISPESTAKRDVTYFTGCLAAHLQPSVGRAVVGLSEAADHTVLVPDNQGCCGLAAAAAGREKVARELAWRNITAFAHSQGPVLTSCASCFSHLATYPDLFSGDPERQKLAEDFSERVVEFSSFFLEQPDLDFVSSRKQKIFYHDPCHQRFTPNGRQRPRQLLGRVEQVELVEAENGPKCCGQGGLFNLGYPDLSRKIFHICSSGALAKSPDLVVTTCSGCLLQWQQGVAENDLPVTVRHLALLLLDCLE
jgi:glycolate oxidase iron-sulfur subunit